MNEKEYFKGLEEFRNILKKDVEDGFATERDKQIFENEEFLMEEYVKTISLDEVM